MKTLFLFNKVRYGTDDAARVEAGLSNDNVYFGMFRVRQYGIETDFLEIDSYIPQWLATFLRRHVLNIWWIHLPLLPVMRRYDVVFSSTAYGSLFVKSLLGMKRPKWVMLDFNISGTIGDAKTVRQKLFRWAVSKCDGIVAISAAEEKTLKEMFPHLRDTIVFFHEGVDTKYFSPPAETTAQENVVLSVGLDFSRDFKTLVEATRDLDVEVVLATKPERVADLQPLPAHVTARLFSRDEMVAQFTRAKVVVCGLNMKADNNDSMGTFSVGEAMSMGKAVIVSKTRSMDSYIEDGVTGVFVPVRDAPAMRAAIIDLMTNDAERIAIGARAREFAVAHIEAEIFAKDLATFFKKVYSA
jgi:glycosyltransferase involved in cell wall biosynthesis